MPSKKPGVLLVKSCTKCRLAERDSQGRLSVCSVDPEERSLNENGRRPRWCWLWAGAVVIAAFENRELVSTLDLLRVKYDASR